MNIISAAVIMAFVQWHYSTYCTSIYNSASLYIFLQLRIYVFQRNIARKRISKRATLLKEHFNLKLWT